MGVPNNFSAFAGKENLMASFNNWLMETINGGQLAGSTLTGNNEFFWGFDFPVAPQYFPAITTTELGLFSLGEDAFDRFLGYDKNGNAVTGARNQTLIEVTCISKDTNNFTGSTKLVRNLRDRVIQALQTTIIPLRDYNNPNKPQIGSITLDPESNSINEKFLVDAESQNIKRYVLILRVFWVEFQNTTQTKTITSSAEIS